MAPAKGACGVSLQHMQDWYFMLARWDPPAIVLVMIVLRHNDIGKQSIGQNGCLTDRWFYQEVNLPRR